MYTICKGFLRLSDMLSKRKCNNILKFLKKFISVQNDLIESFQTVENIFGWLQDVTICRVADIGFQKKILQ